MNKLEIIKLYEDGTNEQMSINENVDDFILKSINKNYCTLISGFSESWKTENSKVTSLPAVDIKKIFKNEEIHLSTASIVEINGPLPEDEGVHYHLSHVIGMVFDGVGSIISHKDAHPIQVNEGDLVIIPRGAMHFFTTPKNKIMKWIAMEISDRPIDYQKHFDDYARSELLK